MDQDPEQKYLGIISELADGEGFWLPYSILDDLEHIGVRGLAVYTILAAYACRDDYPSYFRLGRLSKLGQEVCRSTCKILLDFGLLNTHDVSQLDLKQAEHDTHVRAWEAPNQTSDQE